ncbi:helicase [Longispora fulva]|nr:helicase [Longispora fulva]
MTAEQPTPYAPGSRILVRDEEWLVRTSVPTDHDGNLIRALGVSEFVRDEEATFFDGLERVDVMRPEETVLIADDSSTFRRSRLFLEAVLRRTPLPQSERGLALADRFLIDPLIYQQRPAELALSGLRPRILLADVVGLGKTLEIGLILGELIRRGRGDRILVVTPQHVLEQFQHEMWSRFSLPLVRLDSVGIERIQREIPAGRNPFTYFKRVIVSIDTLKNVGLYGHHLDSIRWDAVVIDESHNLIGETSLRNRLAKLLASQTDALLLASATPHNGDKKSFAELIRLLDPAAIADVNDYSARDIEHLYLRRTKISPEVRNQTKVGTWADRGPSVPVRLTASPAEERIFAELTEVWLAGDQRAERSVVSRERRLFPYTLLKAFLSSHQALAETVTNRLASKSVVEERERQALERLGELTGAMTDADSAKLAGLVAELKAIGVGPQSELRVVVFSERVATLRWLAAVVPQKLGFKNQNAVRVMHGGCTDTEQQRIVEEFSLEGSPVRLLFTGDVASEGVNLHRQCHHLVHYDLPWSLIRIEQRNGRIDRYGQAFEPEFRALILTSEVDGAKDDRTVAEKLLVREEEAYRSVGTAEAVTGEYLAEREERRLVQDLLAGKSVEESLAAGPEEHDVLLDLLGAVGDSSGEPDPAHAEVLSLFGSTEEFLLEALREVYGSAEDELGMRREGTMIALNAPADLEQRLSDLPRSYLAAQRANGTLRLKVTADRELAKRKLHEALKSDTTIWPDVAYLSDIHPLVDWLVDKVLVRLGRQQAPVLTAAVSEPVFLVQGIYCNRLGQPTVVEWMAISGLPGDPVVRPLGRALEEAGVGPKMPNPNAVVALDDLQKLVPSAIEAARAHLEVQRTHWDEVIAEPLRAYRQRLDQWEQDSLFDVAMIAPQRARREKHVRTTVEEQTALVERLETSGEPMLRLLAVLDGAA